MMRLAPFLLVPGFLAAYPCAPPAPLPVTGTVSGALHEASCTLSDGARYTEYVLTLPNRGTLSVEATSGSNLTLHLRDAAGMRLERGASLRRALEAGRYTVAVSSPAGGGYTLRTSFTGESNTACSGFAALGLNRKLGGRLGAAGCTTPAGAPYDGWSLRTLGSGTLDAVASSEEFSPTVTLRGEDGRALASGAGSLSAVVSGDRRYTLVVTGDKSGAYQVSTAFTPADDDPCRAEATLAAGDRRTGAIDTRGCTVETEAGGPAYFDYYEVRVEEAGTAEIAASSTAFSPLVWLLDADGNLAGADTLSAGPRSSLLRLPLAPGSYTVMVVSALPSGGEYTLQYGFEQGPPKSCEARAQTLGQESGGELSSASCRDASGPVEIHRLTLPSAGVIELAMTSDETDPALQLRDEKDDTVASNDDFQGYLDSYLFAHMPAGTYTAVASGGGTGKYSLRSAFTARELAPCARTGKLQANTGAEASLGWTQCRGPNGQPEDVFEFTLGEAGTAAFTLIAPLFDGFLRLTDADGAALRSDDNTYGGGDSLIVQHLPAGSYRIVASSAQTSSGGAYQIYLLFSAGERPPGCSPRGTLAEGATVAGSIGFTGCQLPGDFADVYQFTVSERRSVTLKMASAGFDAYLTLFDAGGNVVDADDDSAGGSDAQISAALPPGTYYVEARPLSFEPYDSGGPYTLAYQSAPAPASEGVQPARTGVRRATPFARLPGVGRTGPVR